MSNSVNMFGYSLTITSTVLISILLATSLIEIFYYLAFYRRISANRKKGRARKKPPVSVIICAKNEAENLAEFLPSVLNQEWPDYEVIVVNDCSEDDTEDILKLISADHPNLVVKTLHKESSLAHSKKMALFIGIKAATNEYLLLTDADCKPVSGKWIEEMMSHFIKEKDFVLGYGGYIKRRGLLNKYVRFDTMFIAMQYMGMALAGKPYMGIGRNLAYRKSLFFDNKGFGSHMNLQSGDDDLFVNSLARESNTAVAVTPGSFTRSVPPPDWRSFRKQKIRHLSTSSYYRTGTKVWLLIEPFARLLNYGLFIYLISALTFWPATLAIFMITFIVKVAVFFYAQKSLNERDLVVFSPLFDLASLFINTGFLLGARKNKNQKYEWK